MSNTPMYGTEETATTFDKERLSPELIHAQEAELYQLKMAIAEVREHLGRPLRVLDIGIGNARVARRLSEVPEMWDMVESYHGIDNSQDSLSEGRRQIEAARLDEKVSVELLDAVDLHELQREFDLVMCTWFTAGNFTPDGFEHASYPNDGRVTLNEHPKFTRIMTSAYNLLSGDGELIIGSFYLDNENTRLKQESAYRNFGWTVITNEQDSFTATQNGWWSQRFTRAQLLAYMPFTHEEDTQFIPLDPYSYGEMMRVKKQVYPV